MIASKIFCGSMFTLKVTYNYYKYLNNIVRACYKEIQLLKSMVSRVKFYLFEIEF
jgi:hypothetical protein